MRVSANNPAYKHFISLKNGIYYFNFLSYLPLKTIILFLFNFLFLSNLYSQVIIKEKVGIKNLRGINTVTQYWPCDGIKPTKDWINFLQYVWSGSIYPLHPGRQNIGDFYIDKNKYYTFRIIEGNQFCHFRRVFNDGSSPQIIENEITVLGRDLYAKDIEGNIVNDSIEFLDCDNNPFYVSMYNYDYVIVFEEILNREERVVYTIEPEGESPRYVYTHIKKPTHTIEAIANRDTILYREENRISLLSIRNECKSGVIFCWYNGGDINSESEFMIRIIEGEEYGELYDEENNYLGTEAVMPYRKLRRGLNFLTEYGNNPEGIGKVKIEISTNDADVSPQTVDFEFYIKHNPNPPPGIEIIFEKNVIKPGESTAIILKERTAEGEIRDFEDWRLFNVEIVRGSRYGEIYWHGGNRYSDYFYDITQGITFIASDEIEEDTVEVEIYASTGGGVMAGKMNPISIKIKGRAVTQSNEDFLEGIGKILIVKKKDCSSAPQCEGEVEPKINIIKIEESHCNDYPIADGVTIFYYNRFEEEFDLSACYNSQLDKWQFEIITPLKYSSEVCYREGKVYLRDTSDLRKLSIDELCNAEIDIANFESAQHTVYKIEEIIRRHEEIHVEQNYNMFNKSLSAVKFYEKFMQFSPNCDNFNNEEKAIEFAKDYYKLNLVKKLKQDYLRRKRETEGNPNSDKIEDIKQWIENEKDINNLPTIKNIIKEYLRAISNITTCL